MTQGTTHPAMSFGTAISTVLRKYAEFEGRAGRPELWWFILFSALVTAALGALDIATPNGVIMLGTSLATVWSIAVLLPTLAVSVRRLRDAGHGWQQILWLLVPFGGVIIVVFRLCEPSVVEDA